MRCWIKHAGLLLLGACLVFTFSGCTLISKLQARDQLNKGVRLYGEKKFDEAAAAFKESIKLDPGLTNAYLYLGMAYSALASGRQDKANEAIKVYQEVIDKAGERTDIKAVAMTSIAILYEDMENVDKAKEWCRELLKIQPQNAEALYRIAVIDFKLSFKKTGNTGEGVAQLSPQEVQKTKEIIDEGIKALNTALQINPDYANAVDYLNLLYREEAKFTKDDARKKELIQKANQLNLKSLELRKKQENEKAKKGSKKIA